MQIHWQCKPFGKLLPGELYELLQLRQEVFVVEQNCAFIDADGLDQECWHLIGFDTKGAMVAYARLVPKGLIYPDATSIGRILTSPKVRGSGAGKQLMEVSMKKLDDLFGICPVRIGAQTYLVGFYEGFGFLTTGENYLEDGIPHSQMLLKRKE